ETDGHYALDLDGMAAAFEQGADVLVLCNPWNPVGRVLTRDELLAVADVVERHGGRVFSDEIHAPLVFAPHRHVPYASVSEAAAGGGSASSSPSGSRASASGSPKAPTSRGSTRGAWTSAGTRRMRSSSVRASPSPTVRPAARRASCAASSRPRGPCSRSSSTG